MEVEGWPGVWALGDCALVPDPATGKPYPPTAQHAIRQGKVLAGNIAAALDGGSKKPFRFSTLGLLAAIGRRTGVANILGMQFSGFIAWFLWRSIYLSKATAARKESPRSDRLGAGSVLFERPGAVSDGPVGHGEQRLTSRRQGRNAHSLSVSAAARALP